MTKTLDAWRGLVNSAAYIERIRSAGLRNAEGYRAIMLALVLMAEQRGTPVFVPGLRKLGELAGCSKDAAQRRLANLADLGLLAVRRVDSGLQVNLSELCTNETVGAIPLPSPLSPPCAECLDNAKFAAHMADDAFSDFPHRFAAAHWPGREMARSLGVNALAVWDTLDRCGALPIAGLQEHTGLSEWSVRRAVAKLEGAGLLVAWKQGRAYVYEQHPDFEGRLDDLRPQMATYGIGEYRAMKNDLAAANYAERQRTSRSRMSEAERARWQQQRDEADKRCIARRAHLESVGFVVKPAKRMSDNDDPPRMSRPKILHDWAAEWADYGRAIWLDWCEFDDLPEHWRRYALEADYGGGKVDRTLDVLVPKFAEQESETVRAENEDISATFAPIVMPVQTMMAAD